MVSRLRRNVLSADEENAARSTEARGPAKRGLRERKRIERRMAILESAAIVFRRKNFDDARIEEIAEQADVAIGTVYNYFPTKDALLLALADHYRSRTPELISAVVENPPADPVEAFIRFYSIMTRESLRYLDKALWRHVHAATTVSGWHQHGSERWRHEESLIEFQCQLIRALQRQNAIDPATPARPLAEVVHASAFFWWQRFLVQDPMTRADFMANLRRDLVFALERVRPERQQKRDATAARRSRRTAGAPSR
jgi:AcrR family transcriptional regulator